MAEEITAGFHKLLLGEDDNHQVSATQSFVPKEEEEEEGLPNEDYYVHVDVLSGSCQQVSRAINRYMLGKFYYDPRRYFGFYDVVFAPQVPTLAQMREVTTMSDKYYELWKVKRNFSLSDFFAYLATLDLPNQFSVRVCVVIDNDHSLYTRTY